MLDKVARLMPHPITALLHCMLSIATLAVQLVLTPRFITAHAVNGLSNVIAVLMDGMINLKQSVFEMLVIKSVLVHVVVWSNH